MNPSKEIGERSVNEQQGQKKPESQGGCRVICEMAKTTAEKTSSELSGEAFLLQEQARPRRHPAFPAQTGGRWEGPRTAALQCRPAEQAAPRGDAGAGSDSG